MSDLLEVPFDFALADDDFGLFARCVVHARELAKGRLPVLIIDQLDDALRLPDGGDEALSRLGPLMAVTAQRLPGEQGYACRWVLCYRHEFHGLVNAWLDDVLRQARERRSAGLEGLPWVLSGADRFHRWEVPLMGGLPSGGAGDREATYGRFLDAVERPLRLKTAEGTPVYRIAFPGGGARRLAEAFARARARDAGAPLVPELQVVLGHLLEKGVPAPDGGSEVDVPVDPKDLDDQIGSALMAHLRRALEEAFPFDGATGASSARARAVLALRELVDAEGRRGTELSRSRFIEAIGDDGRKVLEKLASATVRLIVESQTPGGLVCALAHDRLAEVITRLVDDPIARASLGLDDELMELRRFVAQRTDLFVLSRDETALTLTEEQHARIAGCACPYAA